MLNYIKSKIPDQTKTALRKFVREAERKTWFMRYYGNKFVCVCCGANLSNFNGQDCPKCNSRLRHRVIFKYLLDHADLISANQPTKMLHFAPEYFFRTYFRKFKNIEYYDADLSSSTANYKVDITNIPFKAEYFDSILCVHVLEHIPDDRLAMRELYRVLKPGGWAILQSPVDTNRQTTYEDPTISSPEERLKIFGDIDHKRVYGLDYKDRLKEAGFEVSVDPYVSNLSEEIIAKFGLRREDIYLCRKTAFSS
ncbi:methyltransferase domain-containing protein [bacterium]|nr:methyltransferase domain-containing protein [bacterium]